MLYLIVLPVALLSSFSISALVMYPLLTGMVVPWYLSGFARTSAARISILVCGDADTDICRKLARGDCIAAARAQHPQTLRHDFADVRRLMALHRQQYKMLIMDCNVACGVAPAAVPPMSPTACHAWGAVPRL